MTSLIKWPGGKSREYKNIDSLIPAYRRYIEPFFGGGAIFFQLRPEYALINDISKNLIHFYSSLNLIITALNMLYMPMKNTGEF